jgi:DNA-binding NarL/FixJ family response regulator
MSTPIRIIIVDDHQMFLEGLTALLRGEPQIEVVDVALNGKQLLDKIKDLAVDVVVSDINMPEMDGIELSKQLKKEYPKVKTLILSTHNDAQMIGKCIQNDVDGYLLKNAEKQELLKALSAIVEGEKYFAQEVKSEYMKTVFSEGGAAKDKENLAPLSRREKEILIHIAMEHTTQEIAEKLFISQNTVNTHRKNLMSKLNAKNTAGLVKYAIQQGLLEEE